MNLNELLISKLKKIILTNKAEIFLVGGCVRDEFLNKKIDDYDIEIYNIDKNFLKELLYTNFEIIEVGKSFGVYHIKKSNIDISLPRKEIKKGLKHKDFLIISNPYLDKKIACLRRDFTINSLMKDLSNNKIIDYFNGIKDLKKQIIRHIDDDKFIEDPLRVLRAARFSATLNFKVAEETKLISSNMSLKDLSKERVFNELFKMFNKRVKTSNFFLFLKQINQLDYWFKELKDLKNKQFEKIMKLLDVYKGKHFNNFIYILCMDLDDKEKFMLRFISNKKIIKYVLTNSNIIKLLKDKKISYIEAYDKILAFDIFQEILELLYPEIALNFIKEKNNYQNFVSRKKINGKILLDLGFKPGILIKEILIYAKSLEYQNYSYQEIIELILIKYKK